ncbi:MAG: pitrilysin family protein [Bacteroidota bacterium]|nr:pitrilysin family protein [Bacteroidota bacterium]
MLDRTIQPEIRNIETFTIPQPNIVVLPNGIELYTVNMGEQEVVRLDLMFSSGKWDQEKILAAVMTNMMLKEGAGELTSSKIAELLDYSGSWMQSSVTQHNSYLTLYALNKHFSSLLPIIELIIKSPTFPEEEFRTLMSRQKQQYLVDCEKVENLANFASIEQLFGASHPYGKRAAAEDFDLLTIEDLKKYHQKHYHSANCRVFLTGKLNEEHLAMVSELFGQQEWGMSSETVDGSFEMVSSDEKFLKTEKPEAVQSAVRFSKMSIDRKHPDFNGLRVLNTVLGGYFGSRLMTSIREEKGYTYGIGSSLVTQQKAGYMTIATQTGVEYVGPLIDAVFEEMDRLKIEEISPDEMERVRSYLLGEFARSFDGPFSIADAHISILANQLGFDYYENQLKVIQSIDSATLLLLANKYLNREDFYVSVAGK